MKTKIESKVFDFESHQVRALLVNSEPYFVGKDIAEILGYTSSANALKRHVDEDDKLTHYFSDSGQNRKMIVINESGLYSLILSSKMPNAKKFKHWVTSEVLPTIRKHGAYMTPETMKQALTDPDFIINLAMQLKEEQRAKEIEKQKRIEAEKRVDFFKPRAAYYQMILDNPKLVTASEIADYYDMTTIAFNQLLHELKVQYKQGKTWRLYSKHKGKGWASMSKRVIYVNGAERIVESMKWTPRGQLELYKLLKKNGIVPVVERGHDYDVVE